MRSVKLFLPPPQPSCTWWGCKGWGGAQAFCSKSSKFGTMCTRPCHAALAGERVGGSCTAGCGGHPLGIRGEGRCQPPPRCRADEGEPPAVRGDTGVTPGHAAVARWHAAGWLCQGPRCRQAGRPRNLPPTAGMATGGRFRNPPVAHSTTTAALPLHCAY